MAKAEPKQLCENCGAEMEVIDSWTTKSPPLIGTKIEYVEYDCPECGHDELFRREEGEEEWSQQ